MQSFTEGNTTHFILRTKLFGETTCANLSRWRRLFANLSKWPSRFFIFTAGCTLVAHDDGYVLYHLMLNRYRVFIQGNPLPKSVMRSHPCPEHEPCAYLPGNTVDNLMESRQNSLSLAIRPLSRGIMASSPCNRMNWKILDVCAWPGTSYYMLVNVT